MSQEQRKALDAMLREGPLDLGGAVLEQRPIFEQMMAGVPLPDDVETSSETLGGIPVVAIDLKGIDEHGTVILYLHGGAYALGTAASSVGLASNLGRQARARVLSVDYRLAPEHPHPAALDDAVAAFRALVGEHAPSKVAIAGESAGAGLVAATLVALKTAGLPQPAAAALMSPWVDLTLAGDSIAGKAAVDPVLTRDGLRRRVADYAGGADATDPMISPLFADLTGLPPLLIQAGSHEILLDDATRLAASVAAADVAVTLDVTSGVPHVFQAFAGTLDEADAALARAGAFLRSHLNP
jgi:acetyl esterase/lipase